MLAGIARRPAALLLDAGDTLIFFDGRALADVLVELGVEADPVRLEQGQLVGKQRYQALVASGGQHEDGWSVIVRATLIHAGVDEARVPELLAPIRRAHDAFYLWRRVPAGLPEALGRARAAGIKLAVVSNSEGKLEHVLGRVGLAQYFDVILDSQLEGVQKPDPEIFLRAVQRCGTTADRALMAGDIPDVDLRGAASARIAGVLIAPPEQHPGVSWPRFASVAELVDALLTLSV